MYDYLISGKTELLLCDAHGRQLEQKEVVVLDNVATEIAPPDHC